MPSIAVPHSSVLCLKDLGLFQRIHPTYLFWGSVWHTNHSWTHFQLCLWHNGTSFTANIFHFRCPLSHALSMEEQATLIWDCHRNNFHISRRDHVSAVTVSVEFFYCSFFCDVRWYSTSDMNSLHILSARRNVMKTPWCSYNFPHVHEVLVDAFIQICMECQSPGW